MKTVSGFIGTPRRQHERSFKAELVRQCLLPGASVAAIALAGGVNANMLFKWRRDHLGSMHSSRAPSAPKPSAPGSAVLVPVQMSLAVREGRDMQPLAVSPSPAPAGASTQVLAARAGIIEVDFADAQLRLRGLVDEASLCSVLRALRQCT